MLNFKPVRLSEVGRVITGRTPPSNRPDLLGNGAAFVTPTDISDASIYPAVERRLSPSGEAEFRSILLPPNSVCFTCIASIGKICLTAEPSLTNQQINSIVVDQQAFAPRWVFHALRAARSEIAQLAGGAATPIINKTTFSAIELLVPSLPIQRRIASILGAYDDLIEVNRRRIAVLEEMAQRLFEEWFVQFRFPEANGTPNWAPAPIGSFGAVITGKTPSKLNPAYFGGAIPFIKIPDMHGVHYVLATSDYLTEAGATSQANKTLPADALCVSCIGTIGLVAITAGECQTNQQINALVPQRREHLEFLYFALRACQRELQNLGANGATIGNVNKEKFSSLKILRPPDELLGAFHRASAPLFAAILNISRTQQRLVASRDLLLPRLISGELSVAAAERELEDAA